LLRAAADLFARKGINTVGVSEIVTTAGTARDSLYRLFGSKDALVAATVDHYAERSPWLGALRRAGTALDDRAAEPPVDRATWARTQLLAVVVEAARWTAQPDRHGCYLLTAAADLRGQPDKPAHEQIRQLHRAARQVLQRLAAAAGAEDPEALADDLHGLIYGILSKAMVAAPTSVRAANRAARRQTAALLASAGIPIGG
jgi:AcrR family transcriptional regulator